MGNPPQGVEDIKDVEEETFHPTFPGGSWRANPGSISQAFPPFLERGKHVFFPNKDGNF